MALASAKAVCRASGMALNRPAGKPQAGSKRRVLTLGDDDGQAEDVVLAGRLHAGHVVLAGLCREVVDAGLGERDLGRSAHVTEHRMCDPERRATRQYEP